MDPLAGWARAAAEGDDVAVGHLVRATQPEVLRLCGHLVDRESAEDLAQETYLRALRSLPGYRGDAPFRLWLLGIARRTCADALRARVRRRRLSERLLAHPREQVPPAVGAVDEDQLLAALDPDRRAAFVLTQLLGLSYAEAAEACDVPVGTIRSRVARARADLVAAHPDASRGATARRDTARRDARTG